MARMVRRKKGKPKAAIPTHHGDSASPNRPDTIPALIALALVILLIGSGLYFTSSIDSAPDVEYGVEAELVTNVHNTQPGYDTDFVIIIKNTGTISDTFDIDIKSNDGGFAITVEEGYESITLDKSKRQPIIVNVGTSASAGGQLLSAHLEIKSRGDSSQKAEVRLDVNTDPTQESCENAGHQWEDRSGNDVLECYDEDGIKVKYYKFGNQTLIGDSVSVHYAGILAINADLFDSSIEDVWDNYEYRQSDVTDANKHTATLSANNIGCDYDGSPSELCSGGRGMIPGFDAKMVGMYEGQTLSVRIPAKDAYGETAATDGTANKLAGEDLIFTIIIVSID